MQPMKNISERISIQKGFILMLFIVLSNSFYGQEMPKIIPPSPEASQLSKFVEMPTNLFTGTPSISLPIYSINSKSIEIPISISYHAKGVQVSEIASRVGLGWTLNAGGVITRQVRERPDDENSGYLRLNYLENFDDPTDPVRQNIYLNKYTNYDDPELEDMTPDMFHFNFLGFSGKFIFNQLTKGVIVQSKDDITVTPTFGTNYKIEGFTVKDKYGNIYFFTVVDELNSIITDVFYNNSDSFGMQSLGTTYKNYYSAWYLNKIITKEKEQIDFVYEPETVTYYSLSDYQENMLGKMSRTYHKNRENQQQLKEILYKSTKVIFERDSELREDLRGSRALKNIYVKYVNDTIKKFSLEHQYTVAPVYPGKQNDLHLEANEPEAEKRLFLKSLKEIGGTDEIKTEFFYSDILLPNRHSSAQDVWGYYNGKHINFTYYVNPDRKVDPNYAQAGLLQKIIHPTEGVTEFEYESNRAAVPEFLQSQPFVKDVFMTNQNVSAMIRHIDFYNPTTNKYENNFQIGGTSNVSINSFISYAAECPEDSQQPMYEVKITGGSPSVTYFLEIGNIQSVFALAPGNYTVTVTPLCDLHHPPPHTENPYLEEDFFVVLKWIEIDSSVPIYGPGNRIKRIVKKDNDEIQLKKEYEYTYDNQTCSGKLFAIPNYLYAIEFVDNVYEVYSTKTGSICPISNFNNGELGYEQVIEKTYSKETQSNYKTHHTFTVFKDMGEFYKPLVFLNTAMVSHTYFIFRKIEMHQPTDLGFMRGLSLTREDFALDEYTNGYKKIKRVVNEYNNLPSCDADLSCFLTNPYEGMFYNENNFEFVHIPKFGKYVTLSVFEDVSPSPNQIETQFFVSNFISLKKSTEISYLDSEEEITVIKENFHDSPHHLQLTKELLHTSETGGTVDTNYLYAEDLNNQPLIDAHMLGIPLKTTSYKNSQKLSTQETVYHNWGTTNNPLLLPQLIKTSKGENGSLEVRIRYNQYDPHGNPLEVQQENGTLISYIWGYNHTQPVAKIENMAYNSIPTNLITDIHAATNESAMLLALDALRNHASLARAMVSTYTYIPLVGVKTMTDPKGYTMTYHYDDFNRLWKVTDMLNNILSENQYHYRTQN